MQRIRQKTAAKTNLGKAIWGTTLARLKIHPEFFSFRQVGLWSIFLIPLNRPQPNPFHFRPSVGRSYLGNKESLNHKGKYK